MFKVPEHARITHERWRTGSFPQQVYQLVTLPHIGLFGAFYLEGPCAKDLFCIASDGGGWAISKLPGQPWEHVSVSTNSRPPNWEEMCFIKDLFWEAEDCVVQSHPPRSEYIDCHPYCLHLWRPCVDKFPRPPSIAVGPR